MSQKGKTMEEFDKIDVTLLLMDFLRTLRFMWVRVLVLAVIGAVIAGVLAYRNYEPMYIASTTFTIKIRDEQGGTASSYYDDFAAEQLAKTFPYILTSGVLQRRVAGELGVASISGRISASSVENTNLFTLSVQDRDPEKAHQILQAVINNYPSVSESIVGKVNMKVLDESGVPTSPSNSRDLSGNIQKGAIVGGTIGLLLVLAVSLLRKTIRREEDCIKRVNQRCLGAVPYVRMKERSKDVVKHLNILDEKINPEFKESIRIIRNKVERSAKEHALKTILVTSTMPGEGKSTIAVNLALSLAQEGKRVVLIDTDLRNPTDGEILNFEPELGIIDFLKGDINPKDCMYSANRMGMDKKIPFFFIPGGKAVSDGDNYLGSRRMKLMIESLEDQVDYLILDSAPVGLLTDASLLAQHADSVVYIIKKDYAKTDDILRGMEHLTEGKVHTIGCVLNGE